MERVSVIFLDIDNVLNYGPIVGYDRKLDENSQYGFDDGLCANLKKVLDSVENCKIVISSSWRVTRNMDHISKTENWRNVLERKLGVESGTILGDVPIVNEFGNDKTRGRGYDISAWFEAYRHAYAVKSFVIIDDSVSCGDIPKVFPNNYVDCDKDQPLMGLSETKVKEAIWILTNYGRERKMTDNIFFISDTHFGHKAICKYCNRPWNSGKDENGEIVVTDDDVSRMNEDLISNWNSVVGKDDTVWHLGDFALGNRKNIPDYVSRLNGKINLVLGNHDHVKMKELYEAGFHRVYDRPVLIGGFFLLSHAPIEWVKDGDVYANLYGHVHNMERYRHFTRNTFNCCVEVNNYRPVSWKEIKRSMESYGT